LIERGRLHARTADPLHVIRERPHAECSAQLCDHLAGRALAELKKRAKEPQVFL
jgi:hypothetical protein